MLTSSARASARSCGESVLDYCERELARLRADAPELPFDFTCGFVGYLGYELKAECGGALVHRSPLPDAALVFCDRLIAFDHDERRVHLLALADATGAGAAEAWLATHRARGSRASRRPAPPAPAGARRADASPRARDATPTWPTSPPASTRSSRARPTRSA